MLIISVLITIHFYFVYNHFRYPSEEYKQKIFDKLNEITSSDINKISVVACDGDSCKYKHIFKENIINDFLDALSEDSYYPDIPTMRYDYSCAFVFHAKNNSYLMVFETETYDSGIPGDSVEIVFYNIENINLAELYLEARAENEKFFSLFKMRYGFGQYSLRNHKLYNLINEYIKK